MKIITIFDRNEDFIKLQYESIIRHVKGEYEYIVFDNARKREQSNKIRKICDELGIRCIRIKVMYLWSNPSKIAGRALNASYKYLKEMNEPFFKIDSDMFFISDINLDEILKEKDLVYIPTYSPQKTMWSGVFGINIKNVKFDFNFMPGVIKNTDTFGQSSLLLKDSKYSEKLLDLYNLQDVNDGIIKTCLNNDCLMKFDQTGIIFKEKNDFHSEDNFQTLKHKYENIIKIMKEYDFPTPYNIDFISMDDVDFIFHFKSGNWCPWYTPEYIANKKRALKKFLENKNLN